jgi:hypothetical protein
VKLSQPAATSTTLTQYNKSMRTLLALWLVGALGLAANLPPPRERSFSFEYAVADNHILHIRATAAGAKTDLDMTTGKIAGYPGWAEFYAKGIGWVPVDASEAAKNPARRECCFGAHDVILAPRQQGAPLNYFVYPYVEPDGGKYTAVDTSCAYKDLPL